MGIGRTEQPRIVRLPLIPPLPLPNRLPNRTEHGGFSTTCPAWLAGAARPDRADVRLGGGSHASGPFVRPGDSESAPVSLCPALTLRAPWRAAVLSETSVLSSSCLPKCAGVEPPRVPLLGCTRSRGMALHRELSYETRLGLAQKRRRPLRRPRSTAGVWGGRGHQLCMDSDQVLTLLWMSSAAFCVTHFRGQTFVARGIDSARLAFLVCIL